MNAQKNTAITTSVESSQEQRSQMQMFVEGVAYLDIFDRFDSWFGHWWNRPFWKADNLMIVFLENLTWTGHKRFVLPRMSGFAGYEVELFLRNHGIYVWGRWFDSDNIYFNVKKEQVTWAEYLLMREGIPTANTVVDERNRAWAARHDGAPPGWGSNKRTIGDAIIGLLRPDLSFRYALRSRTWPSGQGKSSRREATRVGTKTAQRRRRRKKQQTRLQQLARVTGARVKPGSQRRPMRPRRLGQPRHF